MAFDCFLKIEGVPGESTDDKHGDWIELLSYSHGVSQPSSGAQSSGGARSADPVELEPEARALSDDGVRAVADHRRTDAIPQVGPDPQKPRALRRAHHSAPY